MERRIEPGHRNHPSRQHRTGYTVSLGGSIDGQEAAMEQQEQTTGGGFVCEKCGASFETQEELDRHIQSEHGEGEPERGEGEAERPTAG
jgi:Zinc finger, C2H2 type